MSPDPRLQDSASTLSGGTDIAEGYDERIIDRSFDFNEGMRTHRLVAAAKPLVRDRKTRAASVKKVGRLTAKRVVPAVA